MIRVTPSIILDDGEVERSFVRASGPGGQNVNKVSTAVQLRFDVAHSPNLPEAVRARLRRLAGKRLTQDGVLVIFAQNYRSQQRNIDDAMSRLIDLIRDAATPPVPRRPTRPSKSARRKRTDDKTKRGSIKALRRVRPGD